MISHKHKFIFVHIPKCGGTSILNELNQFCDEKKQKVGHPRLRIINKNFYLYKPHGEEIYLDQTKYKIFTLVRNPFDRVVSSFFYFKSGVSKFPCDHEFCNNQRLHEFNFSDFVKHKLRKINYAHFCQIIGDYIQPEDIDKIDFIGRFENFQDDFDIICDRIGIPRQQLPHKNKTKHKHYTEYYDEETREIVAEKYAKDIEYFGYKFGE